MSIAIVTGSAGLVGSETSRHFAEAGLQVIGVDNDMRSQLFGSQASTLWQRNQLKLELGKAYQHVDADIRDEEAIDRLFRQHGGAIELVIHTAAQPSHDWAARDPRCDFGINAAGTLNLLEATRRYAADAVFIFTSTNKVYGDTPNRLPLVEREKRWELPEEHPYFAGIPEDMSVDQTLHSLFGASKVAADVLVQEYGRYFGMRTACFRGGCLTGSRHSGTQLHGFLSYLMKCAATGAAYTVFGYQGKQVRDNIHSSDLVRAFDSFFRAPQCGQVYNIGGGRESNCSMLEAIELCESISGRPLSWEYSDENRTGDHRWWISDCSRFQAHYPDWSVQVGIRDICLDIFESNRERWAAA